MVDSVYRTRSLGVAAEGIPDQYADGKAAKVWEYYIGTKQQRTNSYRDWLIKVLKERGARKVLDVACGTGVDSIMLLEEGFDVMSTDASDKMLKYALKERWHRRKEEAMDKWVIEEANWLTLQEDLEDHEGIPKDGFDAVLCLGNSFAHLQDFDGDQLAHSTALEQFMSMVKPGGILLVDHRNYDEILRTGKVPMKNIYYNSSHIVDLKCSNLYVNARPTMVTLDYVMDMNILANSQPESSTPQKSPQKITFDKANSHHHFRLSYYPHCIDEFNALLKQVFKAPGYKHTVFGDFVPMAELSSTPAYYIHLIQKLKE